MDALRSRLEWIKANKIELDGVNFREGRLHVHHLEKDVPETARDYTFILIPVSSTCKID
jgi:hypothetical protein